MKSTLTTLCATLAAGLILAVAPGAFAAQNSGASANFAALAGHAKAAGQTQARLFFLEQAMARNAGQPAAFGPLTGRYFQAARKAGAWSRAYGFFSLLKARHPDNALVLANYGNAAGWLLGMLHKNGYGDELGRGYLSALADKAMKAYARSLEIKPENFTALFGRAIFLSYMPGGMDKAQAAFKHILSLRENHPAYPYAVVYRTWARVLERYGQKEQAAKVMQKGRAALGKDAFNKHAKW